MTNDLKPIREMTDEEVNREISERRRLPFTPLYCSASLANAELRVWWLKSNTDAYLESGVWEVSEGGTVTYYCEAVVRGKEIECSCVTLYLFSAEARAILGALRRQQG